jgi:hypothetical protein
MITVTDRCSYLPAPQMHFAIFVVAESFDSVAGKPLFWHSLTTFVFVPMGESSSRFGGVENSGSSTVVVGSAVYRPLRREAMMGGGSLEDAVNDASIPLVRPAILKSNNNQHLMQQVRGKAIVDVVKIL